MEKAIKRYFPVFALPTLAAFTIGFILPFYSVSICRSASLRQLPMQGLWESATI